LFLFARFDDGYMYVHIYIYIYIYIYMICPRRRPRYRGKERGKRETTLGVSFARVAERNGME
jgi:hypothetical protein